MYSGIYLPKLKKKLRYRVSFFCYNGNSKELVKGVPGMESTILVVDDEKEIADLVELYLTSEGYKVRKFYNGSDAAHCIQTEKPDLAILDLMLPDVDGIELCRQIRKKENYPIIMLTAKGEEIDKIRGLSMGADDYVTKPFKPLELVARVKAQLRRATTYNMTEARPEFELSVGGIRLNIKNHECRLNEELISLTPTEFDILRILCENRGQVISGDRLFQEIWGEKYFSNNNNTIMVHIRHLREKLGETAENPKYIKTVWGVGYKID